MNKGITKKNIQFLMFCIFIFMIFCVNAFADTTICEYDDLGIKVKYDEAGTSKIEQNKYKNSDFTVPVLDWFVSSSSGRIDYIDELSHIKKELYGSCPKNIYACTYEKIVVGDVGLNIIWDDEDSLVYSNNKKIYLFYSEANMKENSDLKDLPNKQRVRGSESVDFYKEGSQFCGNIIGVGYFCGRISQAVQGIINLVGVDNGIEFYYDKYKNCNYVNYTGKLPTYNLACPNLNVYLGYFNNAINEYKSCSKNDAVCLSKNITNVNEKEDLIKNYCKSILQNYDFDKKENEEGNEQLCLEACLDIGVQTKKAKVAAGLISGDSGECGFSGRLLVWISNILRWIKYILPVIVIVMGIIDFIKAIAADKEDEMKKAQGAFVKRLIAAALVFIIPLIIEFILDKMGFGYNDCGIFNK